VALILCSGPEGARADWDLNTASWALYSTVNDTGHQTLDLDQPVWRKSLDRICALPRQLMQEEQAGQAMAQAVGQIRACISAALRWTRKVANSRNGAVCSGRSSA
jgi:hypothetical protein